jgi:hypothetical protein
MLWSQIRIWQTDLNTVNTMLAAEKQDLKTYIETKEKLY